MTLHEFGHSLQEGIHSVYVKEGLPSGTDEKCHEYARSLALLAPGDITDEMLGLLNEAKIEEAKKDFITTGVVMGDLAELVATNDR